MLSQCYGNDFLKDLSPSYISLKMKVYKGMSHVEFLIRTFKACHQESLFLETTYFS